MIDAPVHAFDGVLRPSATLAGAEEAFVPSPCVQNHAANLMALPGGALGCVWFGGSQEGASDVSIWMARLEAGATGWSAAEKMSDDPERSEQNPVLFVTPSGEVWLLYTAQRFGNQDTAIVRRRVSRDGKIAAQGKLVGCPRLVANPSALVPRVVEQDAEQVPHMSLEACRAGKNAGQRRQPR